TPYRTDPHGAGSRCDGCRDQHRVRPQHAGRLQGMGGRNQRRTHDLNAGMRTLTVRHVTVYRYSDPVRLGGHRVLFRPRESHDLRLVRTRLDIVPHPTALRWLHDVFDNSVAIATFGDPTRELRFDSTVTLEHVETPLPHYALEIEAQTYPFCYPAEDRP